MGLLSSATQASSLILVPLCNRSFHYCLGSVGTKIGSEELQTNHENTQNITLIAARVRITNSSEMVTLTKSERIQHKRSNGAYLLVSLDWLSKGTIAEFPLLLWIGK